MAALAEGSWVEGAWAEGAWFEGAFVPPAVGGWAAVCAPIKAKGLHFVRDAYGRLNLSDASFLAPGSVIALSFVDGEIALDDEATSSLSIRLTDRVNAFDSPMQAVALSAAPVADSVVWGAVCAPAKLESLRFTSDSYGKLYLTDAAFLAAGRVIPLVSDGGVLALDDDVSSGLALRKISSRIAAYD